MGKYQLLIYHVSLYCQNALKLDPKWRLSPVGIVEHEYFEDMRKLPEYTKALKKLDLLHVDTRPYLSRPYPASWTPPAGRSDC